MSDLLLGALPLIAGGIELVLAIVLSTPYERVKSKTAKQVKL